MNHVKSDFDYGQGEDDDQSGGGFSTEVQQRVMERAFQGPHTPVTPLTPVVPTTPLGTHLCSQDECIMEDLQLAAELGKTLLERNRELENTIRQQQAVIDDQVQEIEYLSKQTAALREVNDSRLRIYEQLEISIQELEKHNQRLNAEATADKKRIKTLCSTIESLENRCDELQKSTDDARQALQQQRGRNKKRSLLVEEHSTRRSVSCENATQGDTEVRGKHPEFEGKDEQDSDQCEENADSRTAEIEELLSRIENLHDKLKNAQAQRLEEIRKREELEVELAYLSQENGVFQEQLAVLREKSVNIRSFEEELASVDETASEKVCRKCLGQVDDTASTSTVNDLSESIEDTDVSIESAHGECALVKLKNGGYAWGSQESLASMGHVLSQVGSSGTSPGTEVSDAPHNSLLSELDAQYRVLIQKYEALLNAREQQHQEQLAKQREQQDQFIRTDGESPMELVHPGVDSLSGPMSLVMTDATHDSAQLPLKCQRCTTCSCDLKPTHPHAKRNLEEFSEVETSSSGFSDGESRLCNRFTQTDESSVPVVFSEDVTPVVTPTAPSKCLDLLSPQNPCDRRFQGTPEYKKLFKEIFSVLKKTVDKNAKPPSGKSQLPKLSQVNEQNQLAIKSQKDEVQLKGSHEKQENSSSRKNAKVVLSANVTHDDVDVSKSNKEEETELKYQHEEQHTEINMEKASLGNNELNETSEKNKTTDKPQRPGTLSLASGISRSSSHQRRRKRHRQAQQDSSQPQQNREQGNQPCGEKHIQESEKQRRENHQQPPLLQGEFPSLDLNCSQPPDTGVASKIRRKCKHHCSKNFNNHNENAAGIAPESGQKESARSPKNYHPSSRESSGEDIHKTAGKDCKKAKVSYPSVEVAKLRKLEMTYAEALKSTMSRSMYGHKH